MERGFDETSAARPGRGHSDRRPRRGAHATNNDCTGDPWPRLDGDRYANRNGTITPRSGRGVGYDLTLIEAEALDKLTLTDGNRLEYAEARRNIVTRGIDLNSLVGQRFRVGDVECFRRRLREPCAHLERLTHRGVVRKLIHRGGLRVDILTAGNITVGATVESLEPDDVNPPR